MINISSIYTHPKLRLKPFTFVLTPTLRCGTTRSHQKFTARQRMRFGLLQLGQTRLLAASTSTTASVRVDRQQEPLTGTCISVQVLFLQFGSAGVVIFMIEFKLFLFFCFYCVYQDPFKEGRRQSQHHPSPTSTLHHAHKLMILRHSAV